MSRVINKLYLALLAPLRHAVRYELSKQRDPYCQDISKVMSLRATESSALYVEKHMMHADAFSNPQQLLSYAFQQAALDKGKLICEFGVYSGKSINHMASLTEFTVFGFDSFEGLPEHWRDGYFAGTFAVKSLPLVPSNVVLVKGWFNETLPVFIKEQTGDVAFLHVDCDLYSSTKTVFQFLGDRIKPGTVIVFDEYFNYPGWERGEYLAFQEFISESGLNYEYIGYNRYHEQVAVKITR